MNNPPLRSLVLVPVLLSITIGFTVFALYIDRVEARSRIADIDDELTRATQALEVPPPPPEPPPVRDAADAADPPLQLLLDPGEDSRPEEATAPLTAADVEAVVALAETATGPVSTTLEGANVRVLVRQAPNGLLAVTGLPLDGVDMAIARFRRAVGLGGVVIVALIGLVVWLLASRIIRPVTALTVAADRIGSGELDVPLQTEGGSRETARLAAFLERMRTTLRTDVARSEQQAQESEHARATMARFLADMASEVRTPLSALQGYSELYRDGQLVEDGDIERAMDRIGKESGRLNRLAADMLALAQGRYDPDEIPDFVELHRVAANVVDDLHAAFPNHAVRLHTVVADGPYVRGRAERIHQALLNLGANACEHSPEGAPVDITMRQVDDVARVDVIDHGPGVAAEDVESIFQPFVRSGNPAWGGAGLGLAVAREIARENDGRIDVQQTKGGGATFVFTLPLA